MIQQPSLTSWIVPPPPGSRYDQLARTPAHRWWRPPLGTVLIVVVYVALTAALGLVAVLVAVVTRQPTATTPGRALFEDPVLDLAFQLVAIAIMTPLVLGAAWLVQRRPPGTLSSVAGRLRWGWLLRCVPLAILAVVLGEAAQALTLLATGVSPGYGWAGWSEVLVPLVMILLLVPVQAAAEEYAFRGWVVQAFGAYLRNPWWGILISSGVFAAFHGYTDFGIAYTFGFGVLMGWVSVRTGGLEAAIALHAVNNIGAFGIAAVAGELGSALAQGSLPWQTLVGTIVQFGVFGVGVVVLARKSGISVEGG
ncbi:CPBP family intramembrane metalloprotease [Herbidospora sp. NEAU-GS84]|uniref:CPBP family intramembrane metalloprotease n=1 Tax=Herbidospora solisilvae TaxID=2696284 RepID=A0A7C9NMU0_9ACTN|nr:CPBP family intramembrane glutamic endopeptidase [Herbidospora solisilvae]NAS27218.1 CPBP family intramembrane metalloprotease [Herbidospora solisilvae]